MTRAPHRLDDAALLSALRGVIEAAAATARALRPREAVRKAHQDHVTDVDHAVDRLLEAALAPLVPGAPVLSEERAAAHAGAEAVYWIVDPIDGTANLIAGLPFVGISVAFVDARGPRLAAVASLGEARIWLARRGGGAFAAEPGAAPVPLTLPPRPPELVALSTGLLDRIAAEGGARWPALRALGKLRNLGAQSLHLTAVAEGRLAAAASVEARVWDEAAGGLVLREAGGVWRSAADAIDWAQPVAVLAIGEQRSLACHPAVEAAMAAALAGVLAEPAAGAAAVPDPGLHLPP
jgi:myo-inositol-1(or 4)-monophosphatase